MKKNIFKVLFVAVSTVLISSLALAQNLILQPILPFQIQTSTGYQVTQTPFTSQELEKIFGDGALRPGMYRFEPLHTYEKRTKDVYGRVQSYCVRVEIPSFSFYAQDWCSYDEKPKPEEQINISMGFPSNSLGIFPARNNRNSVFVWVTRPVTFASGLDCATVARGVIIGPASIDVRPCGIMNNDFFQLPDDQTFTFEKVASDVYVIHTANGECWDVRDASTGKAQIIRWACNGGNHQKFKLTYLGKINTDNSMRSSLASRQYYELIDGFWRTVSIPNIDFTGTPYSNTVSKRDNGQECKRSCENDKKCVNWTWSNTDPAIEPLCYLRDKYSMPIRSKGTFAGSIRH